MDKVQATIEKYVKKIEKEMQYYSAEEMIKTFIAYTFFREETNFSNKFISAKAQMLIVYAMKIAGDRGKYDYTYSNYEKIILLGDNIFDLYEEILVHKNEDTTKYSDDERVELLVESVTKMKYMFYRKEGYTVTVMAFGRELYKPIAYRLNEIFGFSYSDLEKFYMYVYKAYVKRFYEFSKDRNKFLKNYDMLRKEISQRQGDNILNNYAIKTFKGKFFEIRKSELYNIFDENVVNSIIKEFGTSIKNNLNNQYRYPVDYNNLFSYPILDFEEYIIMPDIRYGVLNLPKLLHYKLVSSKPLSNDKNMDKLIRDEYSQVRGSVIEKSVEEYFVRIFSRNKVYRSLKYGKGGIYEGDITVDCGDVIIVCECKGKLLNLSSAKGDYEGIKSDFSKAIQAAYNQTYRTQQSIIAGEKFYYNINEVSFKKDAKIIKMCITAENFGYIASNPALLLNLYQKDAYPIIFSIHDLNVITDEIKNERKFIEYLIYREDLSCRVHTIEEIDTLISFQKNLTDKTETTNNYAFLGITHDINKKYLKKAEKFIREYKI